MRCHIFGVLVLPSVALAQHCQPGWDTVFSGGDFDGNIRSSVVHNDGTGPALYVSGQFSRAGGIHARGVARWTGAAWTPVGGDFDGDVNVLHVHSDGQLYAAGRFSRVGATSAYNIARWDGNAWTALNGQIMSGTVKAMASLHEFGQDRLWVAGQFLFLQGVGNGFAARFDGSSWTFPSNSVGTFMESHSLAIFNEVGTDKLFVGGLDRGFPTTSAVKRWAGSSWEPVGNPGVIGRVNALAAIPTAKGNYLYAAGEVTAAGGQPMNRITRWNGTAWSPVGAGLDMTVHSLAGFDPDGNGPLQWGVVAGGSPTTSVGDPISPVWFWNGSTWIPRATGMNEAVYTLRAFNFSSSLFTGGAFSSTGTLAASRAAYLDPTGWHVMANTNVGNSPSDGVRCFAWFDDDGSGPNPSRLFVGGSFQRVGPIPANYLAIWNGATWSALPSQVNGPVYALKVFDDGSGPALYAGGAFTMAAGQSSPRIARWSGTNWSPVGQGFNGQVLGLETYAPSSGASDLYACGYFSAPTGNHHGVARWNGSTWTSLGSGNQLTSVIAMSSFDPGSGPLLYLSEGDGISPSVFTWNGASLLTAQSGLGTGSYITSFTVHDDGSGPALFAAGQQLSSNPNQSDSVAKLAGSTWTVVPGGPRPTVSALAVHRDAAGTSLYAGGSFLQLTTGQPVTGLVKWTGSTWEPIGGDMSPRINGWISSLMPLDPDGLGPAPESLWVGGLFTSFGGVNSGNIARLAPCGCYANCDASTGIPVLTGNDFVCFINAYTTGQLSANCDGSTGTPALTASDFICFLNAYATGCN